MILKHSRLRIAALAALGTAAFYTSLPSAAAEAAVETQELQEVVVTGSLLRRTDTETPSPVTVLTAEDLAERGISTVSEGLQRLAINGSGAMTQGWNNGNNFASGANAVSLRGLTVQSTLTVFDNLRMAPYPLADDGHRNFVDLNTIPSAVVERIEILKDGASSLYGADAIAGVVNVITKKQVVGFHGNASIGAAVNGGAGERRIDATYGIGRLEEQGWNLYANVEYVKTGELRANQRSYPFSSGDLSGVCDDAGHCLAIPSTSSNAGKQFGINADGTLSAGTTTIIPLVAQSNATGTRPAGALYSLLNPSAGCGLLPGANPVTLTAAQGGTTYASSQCQQDLRSQYSTLQPEQERSGFMSRFTAKLGSSAEFYAMGSYYNVDSNVRLAPLTITGSTTAPRVSTLSFLVLPPYVCAAGVGTITGNVNVSTGCTAANGTVNPNNPFAAAAAPNNYAIVRWRYDRPRYRFGEGRSLRGATGVNGTFGDDWHYNADFTISDVQLTETFRNWLIPQRIADVAARGTFNFVNPASNNEDVRNYIAPDNVNVSDSRLWQVQGSIDKSLATLPGGELVAAVGVAYRDESIDNPSANPDNAAAPYSRYYTINAVGATGARTVKSGFFEVAMPFLAQLEADLSGRYDSYSSGQSNFSPKIGVKYKPSDMLALRGTYSEGFRIPSFNEAYGLPTTGFSTPTVNCATYAAFCAAHNNNSYATSPYSLGTTATGNPALNPEKSRSYTLGLVMEPVQGTSFTVDYWNIEVRDLISQVSADDRTAATNQYYLNNGVVNIPGLSVTRGTVDPAFPNALPLLGAINFSYNNANKENVSGMDFAVNMARPVFNSGVNWRGSLDLSYLVNYSLTRTTGKVEHYAGTLSPCDYTSCSGSPQWRGTFSNTFNISRVDLTGTVYYTSGYNLAEVDYGGDPNNCQASSLAAAGAPVYKGTTIPSMCSAQNTWNFDLNARYRINDNFTVYLDALNILNMSPPRDTAAAYGGPQYNPVWGQANILGRYFRAGVKLDF